MSTILLAHSNHIYGDKKQTAKMQPYPPLQTLLAAAVLEQAGIESVLFDPTFDASPQRLRAMIERHRPTAVVVCEDDFNFITKMCLVQNRELAFSMAAIAREYGIPAYAHGSDASDHADAYLSAGFRAVLIGEVEETLLELAQGAPLEGIAGLAIQCPFGTHRTAPRSRRTTLDDLPLPAWHLVNVDEYRLAWRAAHGCFSMCLVSSRGCPYRCNWCAKPIFGSTYRAHSPERVAEELRHLKTRFAPDHIWFADDIFALSAAWTRRFAAAVDRLDARVPFKMQSRCDLMTRGTVQSLRDAACAEVWMGAESGSQQVLDAMDKDLHVETVYAARENLAAHGIRACFFLQFGYPGEKWEDIEATIRMVREARPDDVGVSVSYPMPGTKFHQVVSAEIGKKSNWTDSADLAMMFHGEFSTEFYRALAHALHAEVRGHEAAGPAWAEVERLRDAHLMAVAR